MSVPAVEVADVRFLSRSRSAIELSRPETAGGCGFAVGLHQSGFTANAIAQTPNSEKNVSY